MYDVRLKRFSPLNVIICDICTARKPMTLSTDARQPTIHPTFTHRHVSFQHAFNSAQGSAVVRFLISSLMLNRNKLRLTCSRQAATSSSSTGPLVGAMRRGWTGKGLRSILCSSRKEMVPPPETHGTHKPRDAATRVISCTSDRLCYKLTRLFT